MEGEATVPTVTDNLLAQGLISQEIVGVFFAPTQSEEITNGELTFGGTDSSKFTGELNVVYVISWLHVHRMSDHLTTVLKDPSLRLLLPTSS